VPELLTLREASELLKCHPNTLRKWDKKGILVAVRFGERRDRRYRKVDILKLFKGNTNKIK
jgi:excisionase family DNA binding protein